MAYVAPNVGVRADGVPYGGPATMQVPEALRLTFLDTSGLQQMLLRQVAKYDDSDGGDDSQKGPNDRLTAMRLAAMQAKLREHAAQRLLHTARPHRVTGKQRHADMPRQGAEPKVKVGSSLSRSDHSSQVSTTSPCSTATSTRSLVPETPPVSPRFRHHGSGGYEDKRLPYPGAGSTSCLHTESRVGRHSNPKQVPAQPLLGPRSEQQMQRHNSQNQFPASSPLGFSRSCCSPYPENRAVSPSIGHHHIRHASHVPTASPLSSSRRGLCQDGRAGSIPPNQHHQHPHNATGALAASPPSSSRSCRGLSQDQSASAFPIRQQQSRSPRLSNGLAFNHVQFMEAAMTPSKAKQIPASTINIARSHHLSAHESAATPSTGYRSIGGPGGIMDKRLPFPDVISTANTHGTSATNTRRLPFPEVGLPVRYGRPETTPSLRSDWKPILRM